MCPSTGTIQWSSKQGYAMEGMGVYTTTIERVDGSDGDVLAQCIVFSHTATKDKDFRESVPVVYWSNLEDGRKNIGVAIMDDQVWMSYIPNICKCKVLIMMN